MTTIILAQLCTYLLGNDFDVFLILFQCEDGAGARAVSVAFSSIFIISHRRSLTEGSEVKRVYDSSLVALTTDEFTEGCPYLGHLTHLVPFESFLVRRFAARSRTTRDSCVELFEEFGDGASSYERL